MSNLFLLSSHILESRKVLIRGNNPKCCVLHAFIYNRHQHQSNAESERQEQVIMELKKEIENMKAQAAAGAQQSKALHAENKELREQNESLRSQLLVYQDARLHQHFDELKGRTDEIPLGNGKVFRPVYNTLQDLLYGMIYSFETKKP